MKTKGILLVVLCVTLWSCGTRTHQSDAEIVESLNSYIVKVNDNSTLEQSVVEGVLTDIQGAEDIGTYTYYDYSDTESKALYRIKNIEKTGNTREENYYFKDNKLVAITVKSSVTENKKIYLNNGKIISSLNIDSKEQDLLLTKAKRFQNEYKSK
ncbi:hypothetical protein [Formosa sp. PL04]|uniref:hypothetical protein n=1 Tax=Formosa sp. PL04 TaxID=3081755 RepID=UPI0029828D49|nr:hypothetical protein [Formosa sp. PL04]MDW5289984.1 hypothetical protein [Formosa sp. PL04]